MTIVKVHPTKDVSITNHSIWNWYLMQSGMRQYNSLGAWDWPGTYPYPGWYAYQSRILTHFGSLPELPLGSVIIKATLKTYLIKNNSPIGTHNSQYYQENPNPTINIHRITNEWDEGKGDGLTVPYYAQNSGANWTHRTSNRTWSSNGGDIEVTPAASKQIEYESGYVDFDITDLYKKWADGTVPNHGLMIKYANDHILGGQFSSYSKEMGEVVGWRHVPTIEVEYNDPPEPPRALQPNHQSVMNPEWGKTRLNWEFVDYEPGYVPGKMDIVFTLDGSSSFYNHLDDFKRQVKLYLDKLDAAKINYRVMMVDYRGEYDKYYVESDSKYVSWEEAGYSDYRFTCSGKTWGGAVHIGRSDIGRIRYYNQDGYSGTITNYTEHFGTTDLGGTACSIKGSTKVDRANHTVKFYGTVTKPGYSYKVYRGGGLVQYGWQTNRKSFEAQLDQFTPNSGDYQPTWEIFLHEEKGLKTIPFRPDAEAYVFHATDDGLYNSTPQQMALVADWATSQNCKISIITHSYAANSHTGLANATGGEVFYLGSQWHTSLPIAKQVESIGVIDSNDVQKRADIRIWRVESNGVRTLLKTLNATTNTHIDIDPATIPLVNHGVYEWDVKVYDSSNLSAISEKALFTYRNDLAALNPVISWGELPKAGEVVKKEHLLTIKTELDRLAPRFMNVNSSLVNSLFIGSIVPSKHDTSLLRQILIQMLKDSALDVSKWWTRDFVDDGLLDPDDIQYVRYLIDVIHGKGPVVPGPMTATKVENYITPPATFTASNGGLYSSTYSFNWAHAEKQGGGWKIQTTSSPSEDVRFYRLYHQYGIPIKKRNSNQFTTSDGSIVYTSTITNSSRTFYTAYDFTQQQFEDGGLSISNPDSPGELFIKKDGETLLEDMSVRVADSSGHYSDTTTVFLSAIGDGTDMGSVSYYKIEYQVRDVNATQSDPSGTWNLLDTFIKGNTTTVNLRTTGTVWFRVCAVTTSKKTTDYTYTSTPVHARL